MIAQATVYKGHAVLVWHQFCGDRQTIIPVVATANPGESGNVRLEPVDNDAAAIAAAKSWIDSNVAAAIHFASSAEVVDDYLLDYGLKNCIS